MGLLGFGGPASHVALMRREIVGRRGWLTDGELQAMFAACNLVPGPSSTELAIYVGYRLAGWPGLVVGGVVFIVPALLVMLVLAWLYAGFGATGTLGHALQGVRPVVVGIVAWAVMDLGRRLPGRRATLLMAPVLGGLSLAGLNPLLVLAAGGLAMAAWTLRPRGLLRAAALPPQLAAGLPAFEWTSHAGRLAGLFVTFLKLGAVSYGSGYVLYALLRSDLVQGLHWLSPQQLIDAIAIGQATPGPVFTTATFIGYLLGGVAGALLATAGIFLPAFAFVPLLDLVVRLVRENELVRRILEGVNIAVVGLIAAVAVQIGAVAVRGPAPGALALLAFGVMTRWPLSSPLLVAFGALAGAVAAR